MANWSWSPQSQRKRGQQVAGKAGRVQPDQRFRPRGRVAQHNGNGLLVLVFHAVGQDAAGAKAGGQVGLGQPVDKLFAAAAVADQGLDGDDLQVEPGGQFVEFVARGPIAALAEDFDQDAGRLQTGHPRQVDRALGMPGTPQDAAFLRHQRVKVARPDKIGWFGLRIEDFADGHGPLGRGNARAASAMIDRHGEGRLQGGGVVLDDQRQFEAVGHFGQQWACKVGPGRG